MAGFGDRQMGENTMGVFECVAVDRRECKIVIHQMVVANSDGSALAQLAFDEEQKKRMITGEILVTARLMSSFERIVPVEIRLKDGGDLK